CGRRGGGSGRALMGEPLRERLRSLDRRELIGLVAVALLIVGGAALWYVRSLPSSVRIDASTERSDRGAAAGATPTATSAVVIVDVAGWVRRPGVYEFRQGDRVIDAIRLAGGARSGADLQSINLAALLVDGQQIVVPKRGKGLPGTGTSGGVVPGSGGAEALININTATLDQLESLPGIG